MAHHSRANCDIDHSVTIEGTVVEASWRNPHNYIIVDVTDDEGKTWRYTVEGQSIPTLTKSGWNPDSLNPGDRIVVYGAPDQDPNKKYIMFEHVDKENGERLYASAKAYREAQGDDSRATAVSPSTDFAGYWSRVLAASPTKLGVFDPPTDYPLTAAGEEVLSRYAPKENPGLYCVMLGNPRGLVYAYGLRIYWEGDDQIVFEKELNVPRRVHVGASTYPTDIQANIWGSSIGYRDGNELVVESTNFSAEKWGHTIGVDSSERKKIIEKWRLVDGGMALEAEITRIDPVYLTEPVTTRHRWAKVADHMFSTEECELEQALIHLNVGAKD